MDKDMVDKNMLYSFVPPSLGCFFAASADLCDPPSFPSPLFSFLFCCVVPFLLLFVPCFAFYSSCSPIPELFFCWFVLFQVCRFLATPFCFFCTCCSWAVGCSSPTHVFSHHPSLAVQMDLGVACANPVAPRSLTDVFACERN